MTKDVKEIIQDFKETGTEVTEIEYLQIDDLYIIGMKFDHILSDEKLDRVDNKIVSLFPDKKVLVLLMNEDSHFVDFCDEHEEYLRKTIKAQTK